MARKVQYKAWFQWQSRNFCFLAPIARISAIKKKYGAKFIAWVSVGIKIKNEMDEKSLRKFTTPINPR